MIILPAGVTGPNHPRIGYDSIVTAASLSSDQAADGFPIANLGNSATFLLWKGEDATEQSIVVSPGSGQTIDYMGIARHNLGTAGVDYTLESSNNGTDYTEVVTDNPDDDRAIIHQFDSVSASFFRLTISAGSVAPQMAVLYLGQILSMERRLYVGHTPVPFGLRRTVSTGRSESGQFLGRVRRRETVEFAIDMPNLTPAWVRSDLEPFIDVSDTTPFFWAWRPEDYPAECAFCWTAGDPATTNQRPNGMMDFNVSVQGIR